MADGKLIIETELGTKSFEAQYKELESKLKSEQKRLNELMKIKASGGDLDYRGLNQDIVKTESNIEKMSNKMVDLKLKTKDAGDQTDDTEKKFSFNFKKMANKIKRFGLALFSIRSIYSLVSRASSAYLSQDTELAEKLKSVWVGLGSFLAPVLEMISDALLKALGYLNVFVNELTGIDFIARANAKALKTQASAQKELNRQTYDFDVIRTQQDTSSSSGGGTSGGDLFQIPELDEKIVNKLREMAKWLKENWYWIQEVGKILLITFGAVKVAKILGGIASLLGGAGTGLIGLHGILSTLATIGVITLGVDLIYNAFTGRDLINDLKEIITGLKEIKEQTEKNTKQNKIQTQGIEDLTKKMQEYNKEGKLEGELLRDTTIFLRENSRSIANQMQTIEDNIYVTKAMKEEEKALKEQLDAILKSYEYLYQQGKLSVDQIYDYADAIDYQIRTMETLGQNTEDLRKKYQDLTGKEWTINVNTNVERAENKLQNWFNWLDQKLSKERILRITAETISSAGNKLKSIFGFAQGGIVTQPTRALIGEAGYPEAVVPMTQDYLSTLANEIARFGGGKGSGVVNVYLDGRLIQRQIDNQRNQRDFITNN